MNNYTVGALDYNTAFINGITRMGMNMGLKRLLLHGSGEMDPGMTGIARCEPEFSFTTTEIKTALDALGGISGAAMSSSTTELYWTKMAEADRASGLVNGKSTIVAGGIYPVTLRAGLIEAAEIDYRVVCISADGDAAPVATVYNVALSASQGPTDEQYVLGAISLNGTPLDGQNNLEWEFGYEILISGGLMYPTVCAAIRRAMKITITNTGIPYYETAGLVGAAQGATDSTINLDDVADGGVRGSSPVVLSIDAGNISTEEITGNDGESLGSRIIITPTYDGTDACVAYA